MARRWFATTAAGALAACLVGCGGTGTAAPTGSSGDPWVQGGSPDVSGVAVGSPSAFAAMSATAAAPGPARPSRTGTVTGRPGGVLRPGDRGPQVLALQQRLTVLGYWLGTPDGSYGNLTRQAVMAAQKATGLTRDGVAGPRTRAALARGVRPAARTTRGRVIEVDLRRQVLLVVDNGRVIRILNTSTGSGEYYTAPDGHTAHAVTPTGTFRVGWQVNGWHASPLGQLYRPKYFHSRGIAVHGYTSVPASPASHGCVRVSLPAMDMLWTGDLMPVGTRVTVY